MIWQYWLIIYVMGYSVTATLITHYYKDDADLLNTLMLAGVGALLWPVLVIPAAVRAIDKVMD